MGLQVFQPNDVKVYNVTASKKVPEWIEKKNKRVLKRDHDYQTRIQFIQDLEFPEASSKVNITPDGKNLFMTGVYKPQVRCFELSELSMKFERHMDCEVAAMEILTEDWSKIAFLQMDRNLEFHTQQGTYYKTRIPKFGRDLCYHSSGSELLAVGDGSEVWRLSLDLGRFLTPFETDSRALNVCKVNPVHELMAFGTEDGKIEFWDPRSKNKVGKLDVGSYVVRNFQTVSDIPEISCFQYSNDGLTFATGTSSGHVLLYDLRKDTPILTKDHQYGYPIKSLSFHPSKNVISADTKIIKIWDENSGDNFTSVEPPYDINDVCVVPKSGLMIVANENPQVQAFYIPQLGNAPRWCSFLDNLTEELEENTQPSLYDDYKFVTRKELESLGLENLLGTNLLRAFMHGFFIDLRLYEKAKAIANPFAYEEYHKKLRQDKIDKQRGSRISIQKRRLPKVNPEMAERLIQDKQASDMDNPIGDQRFAELFKNPEFQIDENSREYALAYPKRRAKLLEENFEKVNDSDGDEEKEGKESDASTDDDSDDDLRNQVEKTKKQDKTKQQDKPKEKGPKFYEIRQGHSVNNFNKFDAEQERKKKKSFAERLDNHTSHIASNTSAPLGNMEIKFIPKQEEKTTKRPKPYQVRDRRGVHSLKLDKLPGRGRGSYRGGRK